MCLAKKTRTRRYTECAYSAYNFRHSKFETLEDDRTVLYKTKSLDGTKPNNATNTCLLYTSDAADE